MKKITLLFVVLFSSLLFFSCSGEYEGDDPTNSAPVLTIYDTSDIISSKETRIQWYGNDEDGTKMTYHYLITTDTTMNNAGAEALTEAWGSTTDSYVDVSMPFAPFNSTFMFVDSTTYIDTVEAIEVQREIVYSKFFLYATDEKDGRTTTVSKIFGRTNTIPKFPMVNSEKLDINGFDENFFSVGADSAVMVLPEETSFWKPIDFRWMGEDPDGADVDLEFKWELWAVDTLNMQNVDIEMIATSGAWSMSYLSVEFSETIFNYYQDNNVDRYSFRVWVRDDALEQSEERAEIIFTVFVPLLNKGILYVDDTDDNMYNDPSYTKYIGNPDGTVVNALYEEFLQDAGYTPDNTADPLWDYDIYEFVQLPADQIYQPSLKILSKYRLVIIASEDRTRSTGIDYANYKKALSDYMNIGGKVMVIGHSSVLLNDLKMNKYVEPVRDVFASTNTLMNNDMCTFFYNYFGIYSYSTGESKTFFSQDLYDATHPALVALLPKDYYLTDNYDFVGVTKYEHIVDAGIGELKVDSAAVNDYWKDETLVIGPYNIHCDFALKDNGTVLTGIPVFEAYKGEIVLKYQSIYDLPYETGSDSTVVDGDIVHHLKWYNPAAADTENLSGDILQKSGAIATRYISDGDIYRTAYVGFPLVFMDNSEGKVSDFFSAMIDWFDLEDDPMAED